MLQTSSSCPASRRALRRAVQIPCEVISRYLDDPLLYWAADLSPYGIWLETPTPMQIGEIVVVSFQPPIGWHAPEITVFAEVTRAVTQRYPGHRLTTGMGLEFLDLSQRQFIDLSGWLRNRPPPLPRRRRRHPPARRLPAPRLVRLAA